MSPEKQSEMVDAAKLADRQEGDTVAADSDAIAGKEAAQDDEESFIKPSDLPDELKPHWKRMHRAYTKKLEEMSGLKEKASLVDRFYSDPDFAIQTIREAAAKLGFQLTQAQAQQFRDTAATEAGKAPPELVERVRANLSPELQWMAEALAATYWTSHQMTMKPLQDEWQKDRMSERERVFEELADGLSETAPGWEEHEDEMLELLNFLQSDKMTHKQYGSKLQILHGIVTGNASAIQEAVKRIGGAARSKTTSGQTGRSSGTDTTERIRQAKTEQEAWDIAAKEAIAEIEKIGGKVR